VGEDYDVAKRNDRKRFVLIHVIDRLIDRSIDLLKVRGLPTNQSINRSINPSILYPAFSITVIGFSFDSTTSRVITHSRIFF
jgi:hypothetical protein